MRTDVATPEYGKDSKGPFLCVKCELIIYLMKTVSRELLSVNFSVSKIFPVTHNNAKL